jgi:serine/threonine-protein kinase
LTAVQVAEGLGAAHAAGLVHRDIKPANIMFDAATGRAKLTDFGIVRWTDEASNLTQEGVLAGTPAYMSPEQARGAETVDARADVYSLGVTLYEMLTGEVPFRGTPHLVLQQIQSEEPRAPRLLNEAVPRDLETICLKAMDKEPGRRYQTAGELVGDLNRFLRGEPILARPIGPVERLGRWCRRKPLIAALTAALVLALAGGFGGITWEWQRAEENAAEAERRRAEAVRNLEEADAHFRQASQAVHSFYTRVYQEGLLAGPVSAETRVQLLRQALAFYRTLPPQRRSDPTMRFGEAETNFRLAWALNQLGQRTEALTFFTQALPLYEELVRNDTGDLQRVRALAHCHFQMAVCYKHLGRTPDAIRSWEAARGQLEAMASREPGNTETAHYLASTFSNLGLLYAENDESAAARRALETARVQLEKLVNLGQDPGESLRQRIDLALTYGDLGKLEADPAKALPWLEKSRALIDRLSAEREGTDANLWRYTAVCQSDIGQALIRKGKPWEALEHLQKARAILEKVNVVDARLAATYRGNLADCLLHMGRAHLLLRQPDDALSCWRRAIALYQALPVISLTERAFRENLAWTHVCVGDFHRDRGETGEAVQAWQRAKAVWEDLTQADPSNPRLGRELGEVKARLK